MWRLSVNQYFPIFQAKGQLFLSNKQNNTWIVGNKKFSSRVQPESHSFASTHSWHILFNTWNKFHVSAHPCIILYIFILNETYTVLSGPALNGHPKVVTSEIPRTRGCITTLFNTVEQNTWMLEHIYIEHTYLKSVKMHHISLARI
jgi:hypothetical protein